MIERRIVSLSRVTTAYRRWGLGLAWSYDMPAILVYAGSDMLVLGKHFTRDGIPFLTSTLEFCIPL